MEHWAHGRETAHQPEGLFSCQFRDPGGLGRKVVGGGGGRWGKTVKSYNSFSPCKSQDDSKDI